MLMPPVISSAIVLRIMREAWQASFSDGRWGNPDEKCGILRGRGAHISRADRTRNVATDPFTTFEIDPAELIRAYRLSRKANGLDVLGFYHTHPMGDDAPSATDAACAAPDGKLWLIASREGARLWRATRDGAVHGRFDPVVFDMVTGKRTEHGVPGVRWRGLGADAHVVWSEPPRWS